MSTNLDHDDIVGHARRISPARRRTAEYHGSCWYTCFWTRIDISFPLNSNGVVPFSEVAEWSATRMKNSRLLTQIGASLAWFGEVIEMEWRTLWVKLIQGRRFSRQISCTRVPFNTVHSLMAPNSQMQSSMNDHTTTQRWNICGNHTFHPTKHKLERRNRPYLCLIIEF
jgi:hypothetical protein